MVSGRHVKEHLRSPMAFHSILAWQGAAAASRLEDERFRHSENRWFRNAWPRAACAA